MTKDLQTTTELSDADLDQVVGGIDPSGKKTLATIKHPPLDAEATLGPSDTLEQWIAASYDAGHVRKDME